MTERSEPVLVAEDVVIGNLLEDTDVVSGVSFSVAPGEILGIVGESGSGKTLTCRALLGLLPDLFEVVSGSIRVDGRDTAALTAAEWTGLRGSTIAAVFQDPASYLNPSIPVGKQLAEVLRVKKGLSRTHARARALELFDAVHLHDPEYVYQQFPHELSGGMLQRVLIATAIAPEPAILIADEATTALDVTVQAEIIDLLADLVDRLGLALIVISHDLAVVASLCSRIVVLRSGVVVEEGTADQVLFTPQHEYTRLLLDEHHRFGLDRFVVDRSVTASRVGA
jgi:ABC-type glutathione transport system ATPase component